MTLMDFTPPGLVGLQKQFYNRGVLDERERIINLLESFDDSALWRQVEWSPDVYEGFNKQELIALIKGKQND